MTMDQTTEVIIFRLYGPRDEQGSEEARLTVSRSDRWPPSAAFERWVLDTQPRAGRYAAVALEGTTGHRNRRTPEGELDSAFGTWATMNLFTVTYPVAIVTSNKEERPIGNRPIDREEG